MSIQWVLFMCIALMGSNMYANDEQLFTQANALYTAGDCAQAFKTYESIEHKNADSWYNMGNCSYQLGNFVMAIALWKKAIRSGVSIARAFDAQKNIDQAYKAMGKSAPDDTRSFVYDTLERVPFLPLILQLCALFAWGALGYAWLRARRVRLHHLGLVILVSALPIVWRHTVGAPIAFVTLKEAPLFVGPDERHHVLAHLDVCTQVVVCEERGGWCKIRCAHGVGWVPETVLHRA